VKFMSTWSIRPGCWEEAASRFLAGQAKPPKGLKLLGRWHATDLSCGFSLAECDNPATLYDYSAQWSDVLEIHSHVVVGDAEAGASLAKRYGKK